MFKRKSTRVVAFVGSLGASAALIASAVSTTGAYFTDTEDGTLSAGSGGLTLDKRSNYALSFENLAPGEYQTKAVKYRTGGSTNSDVWLHFPGGAAYGAFTGGKGHPDYAPGGLGRFGHFKLSANDGNTLFESWNLTNKDNSYENSCSNALGHGIGTKPTSRTDTPEYCGVPRYIKVESDVAPGSERSMEIVFGVTGRWTAQDTPLTVPGGVPFKVVATQVGVSPSSAIPGDAVNY